MRLRKGFRRVAEKGYWCSGCREIRLWFFPDSCKAVQGITSIWGTHSHPTINYAWFPELLSYNRAAISSNWRRPRVSSRFSLTGHGAERFPLPVAPSREDA